MRNGARVQQGDRLVTMDPRDFNAALLQAEAELRDVANQIEELEVRHRSNQSALQTERELMDFADDEVERLRALKQQNLSAESALNSALSELGRRRLNVTARQLEVDSYDARIAGWFAEDFTLAEILTLRAKERIPRIRPANARYNGLYQVPTFGEIVQLVRAKNVPVREHADEVLHHRALLPELRSH